MDHTGGVTGINGDRSQIEQGSIAVTFRYVLGDLGWTVRSRKRIRGHGKLQILGAEKYGLK
jgi:hypothetical protein